jgi:hypothetical protein
MICGPKATQAGQVFRLRTVHVCEPKVDHSSHTQA